MRLIGLAVIVLLCLWPTTHGLKRAATQGVDGAIQLPVGDNFGYVPAGAFTNLTGHEDLVFVPIKVPAAMAVLAYEIDQLLGDIDQASVAFNATTADIMGDNNSETPVASWAFTDGKYIYFRTTQDFFRVDPSNLKQQALVVTDSGLGLPFLPLLNASSGATYLVAAKNPGNEPSFAVILQADFESAFPVDVTGRYNPIPDTESIYGEFNGGACNVRPDYGYLVSYLTGYTYLWRVDGYHAIPQLAIVIEDSYPSSKGTFCDYDVETGTLLLNVKNFTRGGDLTVEGAVRHIFSFSLLLLFSSTGPLGLRPAPSSSVSQSRLIATSFGAIVRHFHWN